MNNRKKITAAAYDIVIGYATFDKIANEFTMDYRNLPMDVWSEFAALLMSTDKSLAAEATGPDNPAFYNLMMPALTLYLTNATQDNRIELTEDWQNGIVSYLKPNMGILIENALEDYNFDKGVA